MKKIFQLVICLCGLLWLGVANAQLYKVENVPVEAESASAMEAKEAALAAGQVLAFRQLIARLSPDSVAQVPEMSEEEVLSYVSAVSIESEKTTSTKYMGRIAVEFDPVAVKSFLNTQQVTYLRTQAPTLLVIPEYVTENGVKTLTEDNPLYQALKEQGNFAPFYQAVVPEGTEEELKLIEQGTEFATALLPAYQKDKVMVLRLTSEGNDMWLIQSSFYPAVGMQNQVVYKRFHATGMKDQFVYNRFRYRTEDQKTTAIRMTKAVFDEMEQRWRLERTSSLDDKQTLYLRVDVNSVAEWLALERERKGWTFFEETKLKGVFLPSVLIEVTYKGDEEKIRTELMNHGWIMERDLNKNSATLTRVEDHE